MKMKTKSRSAKSKEVLHGLTGKELKEYMKGVDAEHEYYERNKEQIAKEWEEFQRQMEMKELRKNKAKNKSRDLGR